MQGLIGAGQRHCKERAKRRQETYQQASILYGLLHRRVDGGHRGVQQEREHGGHSHVHRCEVQGMWKTTFMHQVLVERDESCRYLSSTAASCQKSYEAPALLCRGKLAGQVADM